MPRAHIVIESPIQSSFRVEQVKGMFDVPDSQTIQHEWNVNLPIEDKPWQIGLIVGPSGSGKTTIGRQLFPDAYFHEQYEWPEKKSILDGFPGHFDGKTITQTLSSVGFSSPPHWLKPFQHLSNGQKFRCELARTMLEDTDVVIFDEFTSVVDRDAAKVSSAAVAKALRKRKAPKLIALSCHYDICDWLSPDWVFDTANESFSWRLLQQRPPITLEIHKADSRTWEMFRGHHYLSRSFNRTAIAFVATWNGTPVGFTSILPSIGWVGVRREHRTVVLPDFQGVGIGNAISEWLGSYCKSQGWRFTSSTSHPAMIRHRVKSEKWVVSRVGCHNKQNTKATRTSSANRITAACEYVGPMLAKTSLKQ